MARAMAWTEHMSARHGLFQAPTLRRQGRPSHLSIRLETRHNTLTAEQTTRAIETQLRRAEGADDAAAAGNGSTTAQTQPKQYVPTPHVCD